jgi:hypothetical protein
MFRFLICGIIIKVRNLRTGTPKKFAEMRYRNEPKNLREREFGEKKAQYVTGMLRNLNSPVPE